MTLKPTITDIRERRYSFDLSAEQIRDLVADACLAAAGLEEVPEGMIIDLGGASAATVNFTVHLDDGPAQPRIDVLPADPIDMSKVPVKARQSGEKNSGSSAAAKAESDPDPRQMHWDALTADERLIVNHLDKMTDTFTAAQDLAIAQRHIAGVKTPVIASEMGETAEDVTARFNAMQCAATLGPNGKPSLDGQRRLLVALRYRAGHP